MIPAAFDYVQAASLEEAAAALAEHGDEAKVLAGGQSLIPLMRLRLAQPSVLVDVGRVGGLDGIRRENGTLVVGALARHVDIAASDVVRDAVPLLSEMAAEVGDQQVRNLGTMGGVMAHGDAAGDYGALARLLDAEIVTTKRTHSAASFFQDLFTTALEPDELVTEVRFPVLSGGHAYIKWRRRLYDWALAGVAVQRDGDAWRVGYVALGATPIRGAAVERALAQGAVAADAAQACTQDIEPRDDVRATADYRRHLAAVITRRALQQAGAA